MAAIGVGPRSVTLSAADVVQAPGASVQLAMALPTNVQYDLQQLTGHYGMALVRHRWVLGSDWEHFLSWSSAPFQLDRPARWSPVEGLTLVAFEAHLCAYFGFWAVFTGVQQMPRLWVRLVPQRLCMFRTACA